MSNYWDVFVNGYSGYANYLKNEILHPTSHSYFYWLILVSLFFFALEVVIPCRKKQSIFRKDFWLDGFYMFFNFFIFSLIIYNAASDVVVTLFNDGIQAISGFNLQANNPLNDFPVWAILLTGFVVRDFVQWWIHRLLHKSDRLWEFHKVHHSVQEMGFAAHLRYHWMENVVYRTLEYVPLALLGIGLHDFFVIHIFTLAWGHFNHSNIRVSGKVTGGVLGLMIGVILAFGLLDLEFLMSEQLMYQLFTIVLSGVVGAYLLGPLMKYIFNSPELHIWHHARELPEERRYGVNFALTLCLWDYLFGTVYQPEEGRDIALGFPGLDEYPENFLAQNLHGFGNRN